MSEYKVWIEYGYHGVFSMMVIALSMEDAVRIAIAEGVPASFAGEKMTRLSVRLNAVEPRHRNGASDVCCNLEECDYNMRVHLLARAKKLAGIEEEAI